MANQIIRPDDLPPRGNPVASEVVPSDNGSIVAGVTWADGVNAGRPLASQNEAEAGVQATKAMTPLTTKQSIASEVGVSLASKAQGDLADSSIQTITAGANISVDDTDPQNLIISSSGGVGDGDKGGVVVSGSGTVWTVKAFTGDSGSGGTGGGVPAPAAGDAAAGKVLGAGGGWVDGAGSIQPGRIVNTWSGVYTINTNIPTVIPFDNTVPDFSEGVAVIQVPVAPSKATNILRCRFSGFGGGASDHAVTAVLFIGSTAFAAASENPVGNGYVTAIYVEGEVEAGSTSSITVTVRIGPSGGSGIRLNGTGSGQIFGGTAGARLVVEEIEV